MRVFIKRVLAGDSVTDMVPETGYCRLLAEEPGYVVSIGGKSIFLRESDMGDARMLRREKVSLDRYGD